MKIRKLTVRDRKRLSYLVKILSEKIGDKSILNMISSSKTSSSEESESKPEDNTVLIGVSVLKLLLETLENETQEWFSDLVGVTVDEFYSLPIDTEALIIKQIVEAEESNSFFTVALELYSKIQTFQSKYLNKKDK